MRAKADQNREVKRILLATDDLILKPDHHREDNPPPPTNLICELGVEWVGESRERVHALHQFLT